MTLADLTDREAVLSAIREYDALGRDAFLRKYGYRRSKDYLLEYDGKTYDSEAIAGAAYGIQHPHEGALKADEFSGGHMTVEPTLRRLGFEFLKVSELDSAATVSSQDITLLRASRTTSRYAELPPDQLEAYRRVHIVLEQLGHVVLGRLGSRGKYSLKLTSGFNPSAGVRGALPKDLWFSVSSTDNDIGMPQIFMIVSTRGVEYGYAPAIHPSDFSNSDIKQKVRDAAPMIFAFLPSADSEQGKQLDARLRETGPWHFRRKARLDPNTTDFPSLATWLEFLKSPAGAEWAGGSISCYLTAEDIADQSVNLASRIAQLPDIFGDWMTDTNIPTEPQSPDVIRSGLEEFLSRLLETRQSTPFGQHDELKEQMKQIRKALEDLPALRRHPHVKVSWSLGTGNWAKIPWIALMDERETDSTQRGIYVVYLFPEDMSGVYATLNQGVTDIVSADRRQVGRQKLRGIAEQLRVNLGFMLSKGFALDGDIDLHTEGLLGQDYEASTIAYKFYAKGEVPDDNVINKDLSDLLDAYSGILSAREVHARPDRRFWIFQANPTMYDLDGALDELGETTWLVNHFVNEIKHGDAVALWRSGKQSGVVALATVLTDPAVISEDTRGAKFTRQTDKFDQPHMRVRIRIDQVIRPDISRARLIEDPILRGLTIIRAPMGTNFAVTGEQERALMSLINNELQWRATSAGDPRVWVYAPGRNAEFWDSDYEQSIMAIGWDDLGDLSQYGSVDDVMSALASQYPSDTRQTNNARTCFDFAQSMRIGDLIFVKRGRNLIIGQGVVVGDYEYQADRAQHRHVRRMRWESRGEWTSPETLALKTLTEITNYPTLIETLKQLVSIGEQPDTLPTIARERYDIDDAMSELFIPREDIERALRIWQNKKNLILQGAPGVGKSFVARRLAYALMGYSDPTRVRTVQFHQSYSYEDFVQGYRPDGQRGFELKAGVFLEFCEKARIDPGETYVFIIDEINRGNLSRIFSELMLLIEPDKRSTEWATKLAYAKSVEERFYVPKNVFILGLMNTADRSLSLVDYALRRRFGFITLKPQFEQPGFRQVLKKAGVSSDLVSRIVEKLGELNKEIADDNVNLGSGFCIGHSFFVPAELSTSLDERWYEEIIESEIRPLLEEYWSDDPDHAERSRKKLLAK